MLTYEAKTGAYSFQLNETRFVLDANLLREALEITPIDQAHQFMSPPSGDAIMDFVNELGYTEVIHFMSRMAVNNLYQPWRAILSMINQSIQTFLTDKANLGSPTKKGRKDKPYIIPYCRFTKLIIYHLRRIHNIHQRSASLFHLVEEDLRLGNLKFVSKGEVDEVFGMHIPNELTLNNIRNAPYYNAYLEMVAKHDQKVAAEKEGKKKTASTKQPKPKPAKEKPSKPSTAKPPKPKPAKEKSTKATPLQKAGKGECKEYDVERAIQMSLESFHQGHAHVGGVAIRELIAEATRPLPVVEGNGKAIVTEEQAAQSLLALHTPKRRSTIDQFIFQRRTPATEEVSTGPSAQPQDDTSANIIRDSPSLTNAETGAELDKTISGGDTEILQIAEELGEDVDKPEQVFMDENHAGPDPRESGVALAGPDPEPTHDEFMANLYPKNLEDAYTIGDQFINDKSTEDELEKLNIEAEVVSMVNVLIYQASSLVPPLSTPLAARVATLEKKLSDLEKKNKNLDNTTQNLGSRVFTLELRDLPHKIDETVHESVKEVVHVALQALLRDCFRELPEADMKEILHQRMFKSGTYKSLPEHVALYEALKASMERAQRDEFLAEKDKSRKRQRDDQDPPPPPLDSDPSKKKRHTSDASGSSQPPAP
ncbi:hypothetical protein Tco_0313412 [Tanacetum coccineum]